MFLTSGYINARLVMAVFALFAKPGLDRTHSRATHSGRAKSGFGGI
jgi:hypothetical protein